MIIGIDLDDTLIETTKTGNKYLKMFVKDNSITDYHDLDKDEYLRFYGMYLYDIQKWAPLKKGALEVLNYLHSKNIKIVIITARGTLGFSESIPVTLDYLKDHNVIYDKIIFKKNHKSASAKQEKIDLFIDDKEKVLDEIKRAGIKTLRFTKKDEKSNHDVVSSWKEVKIYIDNLIGEVKNEW